MLYVEIMMADCAVKNSISVTQPDSCVSVSKWKTWKTQTLKTLKACFVTPEFPLYFYFEPLLIIHTKTSYKQKYSYSASSYIYIYIYMIYNIYFIAKWYLSFGIKEMLMPLFPFIQQPSQNSSMKIQPWLPSRLLNEEFFARVIYTIYIIHIITNEDS